MICSAKVDLRRRNPLLLFRVPMTEYSMFRKTFSNADIANIDCAKGDRAALLGSLHKGRALRQVTESSGWEVDVAGRDQRSVRAYLAGKGDLRTIGGPVQRGLSCYCPRRYA